MRFPPSSLASIAAVLVLSVALHAQDTPPNDETSKGNKENTSHSFDPIETILESLPKSQESKPADISLGKETVIGRVAPSPSVELPENVKKEYDKTLIAELRHKKWEMQHREMIYTWQHWAGIVVFLVAVGIVIAGMIMSWVQFRLAFLISPQQTDQGEEQENGGEEPPLKKVVNPFSNMNRFELSPGSVKLSTSFIGVVILALSLAFFYLYLKFVFVIT